MQEPENKEIHGEKRSRTVETPIKRITRKEDGQFRNAQKKKVVRQVRTNNITVRNGDDVSHTISRVDHGASQRPVLALKRTTEICHML